MHKTLFGIVIGLGLSVASAQAGLFDQIATANWPSKASEAYKVEAYGFDSGNGSTCEIIKLELHRDLHYSNNHL